MTAVRARLAPATWEAFRLLAIEGLSGAEAAEKLGMKLNTAFVHRRNVQNMLRDEIRKLEASLDQYAG